MNDNGTQLSQQRLAPLEKNGATLLSKLYRTAIIEAVNAIRYMRIMFRFTDGVGGGYQQEGTIKWSPMGLVVISPEIPLPGSGSSASSVSRYRYKDDLGSCLKCRTWDGTTEGGTDVYIAKKPEIRDTVSSVIQNGTTYDLTYSLGTADTNGNHYVSRTVKVSGSTVETDYIDPPFLYNDDIYAITIPPITLNSQSCALMDISPRAWAES